MNKRINVLFKNILKKIYTLFPQPNIGSSSAKKMENPNFETDAQEDEALEQNQKPPIINPDLTFNVKQKNSEYFEVSPKRFPGIIGRGVSAEQAFEDLFKNMNEGLEHLVQSTLSSSIHKKEIIESYQSLVQQHKETIKKKTKIKKFLTKIEQIFKPKRNKTNVIEANIFLKEPISAENLLEKIYKTKPRSNSFPQIPKPKNNPKYLATYQVYFENENKLLLNISNNDEMNNHMLYDDEGFVLDELFSFGIVVNLN